MRAWCRSAVLALATSGALAQGAALSKPVGDGMPASLTGSPGDAERGRAIVVNRQLGLCLLCHSGPFPEERMQGNLAPSLAGAGTRWSEAQLRLRIVDSKRLNPDSLMPAYHRSEALVRVGRAWEGQPLLTAAQVEDVVAFLVTLRE
jgi:L-cysteine S-thiosulfotransferase